MSTRPSITTASPSVRSLSALGSILLVGAAAAVFSVSALAGGHAGHPGHQAHKGGHHAEHFHGHQRGDHRGAAGAGEARYLDRLLGDAKLTDAQRAQIRDIHTQANADLKALHQSVRDAAGNTQSLYAQVKPDAAAAERARQQRLAQHDKVSKRLLQKQLDIANVLTPAQRAKIATELKVRQERQAERLKERAARHAARAAAQPAASASAPR